MEPLFVVGPMRSGTTLLASLLDDHPDVLVWPLEWQYFTVFWPQVPGDGAAKRVSDINARAEKLFRHFENEAIKSRYSTVTLGKVLDAGVFRREIEKDGDALVGPLDYLDRLGAAFAAAHRNYAERKPRYFLVKVMLNGMDWSDEALCRRHKMIFTYRPLEKSYRSARNKFFGKLKQSQDWRAQIEFFRDQCLPLLYNAKLALDALKWCRSADNVRVVSLEALRSRPEETMAALADFLGIENRPQLTAPTFLGNPFEGHFHDPSLNTGKIANRETEHPPVSPFEAAYLSSLDEAVEKDDSAADLRIPLTVRINNVVKTAWEAGRGGIVTVRLLFTLANADIRLSRLLPFDLRHRAIDLDDIYRPPRTLRWRLKRLVRGEKRLVRGKM